MRTLILFAIWRVLGPVFALLGIIWVASAAAGAGCPDLGGIWVEVRGWIDRALLK